MFGVAYGLSTVLLYRLLSVAGVPTFYDKLLQVPILNLSIKGIDRLARSKWLRALDPSRLGRSLAPRRRHLGYIAVWTVVFVIMSVAQGVGDNHRGQWLPFWRQACSEDRPRACDYLASMESRYCDAGSGWACNEFAILQRRLDIDDPVPVDSLEAGCDAGFAPACENRNRISRGDSHLITAEPTVHDYPILLRGSKAPIRDRTPASLYDRACDQGWTGACARRETSSTASLPY
jgi:hypothetical protein